MATKQTRPSTWQKLRTLAERLRLAWRLFGDPLVPLWTKMVPIAALFYLVWPLDIITDLIPGLGQIDDIAVLLAAIEAFVRLCPRRLWLATDEPEPQGAGSVIEGTYQVGDDLAAVAIDHDQDAGSCAENKQP